MGQKFTDYAKGVASALGFNKGIISSKGQDGGIKVDLTTPAYPWFDMEGPVYVRSVGANSPSYATYQGSIKEFQFSTNDEVNHTFHNPHDYAMGTDLYIHVHWSHNSASTQQDLLLGVLKCLMRKVTIKHHLARQLHLG